MSIEGLSDICADAGTGTDELIGEHGFPLGAFYFVTNFNNHQRKRFGLGKEGTVSHVNTCFVIRISIRRIEIHHTYYLLLLTCYFTKIPNAIQGNSEEVRGKK